MNNNDDNQLTRLSKLEDRRYRNKMENKSLLKLTLFVGILIFAFFAISFAMVNL